MCLRNGLSFFVEHWIWCYHCFTLATVKEIRWSVRHQNCHSKASLCWWTGFPSLQLNESLTNSYLKRQEVTSVINESHQRNSNVPDPACYTVEVAYTALKFMSCCTWTQLTFYVYLQLLTLLPRSHTYCVMRQILTTSLQRTSSCHHKQTWTWCYEQSISDHQQFHQHSISASFCLQRKSMWQTFIVFCSTGR